MKRYCHIKVLLAALAVMAWATACSLGGQSASKGREKGAETVLTETAAAPKQGEEAGAGMSPGTGKALEPADLNRPDMELEDERYPGEGRSDPGPTKEPGSQEGENPGEEGASYEAFAERIQEAVADKDMEALSKLIHYPLCMEVPEEESLVILDKEEFLKQNPDFVFGDDLMVAVATVDTAELSEEKGSVFLGDGETGIAFSVSDGKAVGITRIHQ